MEKTIATLTKSLVFWCLIFVGLFIILVFVLSCGPVVKKQAPEAVIKNLNDNFFLQEAIDLSHSYDDRKKAQAYFVKRKGFSFSGSEQQELMTVDGYMPQEQKNIIGVSLFFHGQQEKLVMVNVTVNPLAYGQIHELINKSLDSVEAPGKGPSSKAKLYFLGLHPLGPSKVMKIMIREDTMNTGPVYSINYAISAT